MARSALSILACFVIVLVACGCGSTAEEGPTAAVTATLTPAPTLAPTPDPSPTFTPTPTPEPVVEEAVAPISPVATPLADARLVQAQVVEVMHGDTIKVLIDGQEYCVRYIGIASPQAEHHEHPAEALGEEAAAANRDIVEGMTVLLEKDNSHTDPEGHLLRYVWLAGDQLVNQEMVERGLARSVAAPPDTKYQDLLDQAQVEAQAAAVGIWAEGAGSAASGSQAADEDEQGYVCEGDPCIKGVISQKGKQRYHYPGCACYDQYEVDESKGERWFSSEAEAQAAGWRKVSNCP